MDGIERDCECDGIGGCEKAGVGCEENAAVEKNLGGKQTCLKGDLCKFMREGLNTETEWNGMITKL
jgi:hypothetical protein